MEGNNIQKAGNNSIQNQYTNCNFVVGITEEKVREIIKDENKILIASYNEIARDVAMIRSKKIEEKFVTELVKEKLLEELKRPEILVAIRETGEKAICTDDEKSYELLSKLLSNRIKHSNNKIIASSLKNATEVATEITDEALTGLTVFFLMTYYSPINAGIRQGLESLNDMFKIIDLNNLPKSNIWLEQLDVLKLGRINSVGSMKELIDYYSEKLNGYVCVGIKKDSEQYKEAVEVLEKVNLTKNDLVTHELNEEYVRLPLANCTNYQNNFFHITVDGSLLFRLSEEQHRAYEKIIGLYERNDAILNKNKEVFAEILNQMSNLKRIRDWWDKINLSFNVTIVGLVLAYTNINNISKNFDLPKIELKNLIK